ncbi:IS481 family transposase [Paraconexibacter sp. AEG42_29]
MHANARLSPIGRQLLVDRIERERWSVRDAAESAGISERTAWKWLARWRSHGVEGLQDRSSAPRVVAGKTSPETVAAIVALRRVRFTGAEIAELLEKPLSTVSAVLKREGLGKLSRLDAELVQRYERARPGELIHIDVKKLGRIKGGAGKRVRGGKKAHYNPRPADAAGVPRKQVGWDAVHIAIDDATRLAYAEVLPNETGHTAAGFLRRAVAYFASYGITVERLLTDNGAPYISAIHAVTCSQLRIRHLRTRPYRPQTNGKAERFIRTMLEGWAYGAIYGSTEERTRALDGWLWHYNHRRRHQAIGRLTPATRLNNLLGTYT